ncbi:hypothetical protein TGPRC2_229750 [Toxoplasma gondii TgCatPRC2]|uniref:Uncharacterized protein n=1 Tax=Toxoplasma gondii TgCatPRC2 TaxID=1130821 RepID=A0A151HE92_TOXGO|nr:hypothetical protein TGPRC2_229750 [Toxoplasma gondii TgCatPRC2]
MHCRVQAAEELRERVSILFFPHELFFPCVVPSFSCFFRVLRFPSCLHRVCSSLRFLQCGVDRYAGGEALERSEMERPSEKVKKTALLAEKRLGVENGEEEGLSAAAEDDSVPE